jgi:hypothetical protein
MDERDIREKKAALRREIKEGMQRRLDEYKRETKERIGREKIPVEEKRRKYRREVHEEKLRLMELAKEEFRARKRMLGLISDEGPRERLYEEPIPVLPSEHEEGPPVEEELEFSEPPPYMPPEEAFVHSDESEGDVVREYEAPIDARDALPPGMEPPVGPEVEVEETYETNSLLYYIVNLILHPVQALDEFDEYLASPSGLAKVVAFYFVSLLPVVLFVLLGESIAEHLPGGMAGSLIGSAMLRQAGVMIVVGQTVLNLLLYSLSIAAVNYLVAGEANFITLTVYFAFVEGVTRVVIYTLIILVVIAVVVGLAAPQLLALVGSAIVTLFFAFLIWMIALNIIVLMSAYGYGFVGAFFLAIGALVVRWIFMRVVRSQFGFTSF